MDAIVLQAMAKWPNVPAVHGWLSLDRRGNWLLKGEPITNEALNAFIGRNYLSDETGSWFFQNGPQRVFVALSYTPFVYRVSSAEHEALALDTHTGLRVERIDSAWMDEEGAFILVTEHGPGVVYDLDLDRLTPYFTDEHGMAMDDDTLDTIFEHIPGAPPLWLSLNGTRIRIGDIRSTDVARRCGFVAEPSPEAITS